MKCRARADLRVCAPPAPEVISNSRSYDGKLADVWSAGVMLYVILFCGDAFCPTQFRLRPACWHLLGPEAHV